MKTITLINPKIGNSPPMGLLYLGSVLEKANYDVKIIEFNSERGDFNLNKEFQNLESDVIGIVCLSEYKELVKEIISKIKKDVHVIVGGVHATAMPKEVLDYGSDYVIMGEGENTILPLLNYIFLKDRKRSSLKGIAYKEGEKLIINPNDSYVDVNNIPFPAYHLVDMKRYTSPSFSIRGLWLKVGWILTSRGCTGRCTYCSSYLIHGHKVRMRNADSVIKEIKLLYDRYNIQAIYFLDDTFTIDTQRVVEICGKLKESGMNLKIGLQARVDCFNETQAKALKEANCIQVDFGVESGSQKILNYLKKGTTVEQTKRACSICKKYGLRIGCNIMIGTPYETKEDIDLTKNLVKEIKPDYIIPSFTTAFPATELYKEAIEKNWIDYNNYNFGIIDTPEFTTYLSRKEFIESTNEIMRMNRSVIGYLKQPALLKDLVRFSLKNPLKSMKLFLLLCKGKRVDLINNLRAYKNRGEI